MTLLGHDRYCDEIITQTTSIRDLLKDADLSATVPTCPDWTLARLVRHIGTLLYAGDTAVRTGTAVDDPAEVPEAAGPDGDDPAELDAWLAEGAARCSGALRGTDPGTPMRLWNLPRDTAFWARRATHELVVHRADVAVTVEAAYTVAPEVAVDTVDELLELFGAWQHSGSPGLAKLRGLDGSIHLHATDTGADLAAEWLIELGEDGFTWRHGHEKATVALRGPICDVLRVIYRRLPPGSERVEVLGESALLDSWLEHTSFG
ncbi:maleylpyruvate isomerase family mycothiol-dependent enzyme [Streptosporangium sp. NPDC051022]|uniref:maleylpyruvate isomerase family mycothiol-dependent enzyme n=1 Tax=Streptosporangium sp. NPDC051022 TaxID=3155752 RepID=UPI003414F330